MANFDPVNNDQCRSCLSKIFLQVLQIVNPEHLLLLSIQHLQIHGDFDFANNMLPM